MYGKNDCYYTVGKDKTRVEGQLMGIYQYSMPIDASILVGGHPGGVVAYPVALVQVGDKLEEIRASILTMIPKEDAGCLAEAVRMHREEEGEGKAIIINEVREELELEPKVCSHESLERYTHGYPNRCRDCGAEDI